MRLAHICVGGDDSSPGIWGATYRKCRLGSYPRLTGWGALGGGTWNLHFKPLGGLQAQPSLRTALEEQMAKPWPTQRCYCSMTLPRPGPCHVLYTHSCIRFCCDPRFTDAEAEAGWALEHQRSFQAHGFSSAAGLCLPHIV